MQITAKVILKTSKSSKQIKCWSRTRFTFWI